KPQTCEVRIVDRSPDGMGIRLRTPLQPGWPVLITPGEEGPVKAVVKYCRCDTDGWFIGVLLVHRDRRRFDRRPVDVAARLVWSRDSSAERDCEVRIRDVAEGGVLISSPRPFSPASAVSVVHEGWQRNGTIVHCVPEADSDA